MLVVVGPDFLMAVEAERDPVVRVVGATRGFVYDVSSFNVYPALLAAQTTKPVAAGEHRRFYSYIERHCFPTVRAECHFDFLIQERSKPSCCSPRIALKLRELAEFASRNDNYKAFQVVDLRDLFEQACTTKFLMVEIPKL
jgi:hypothetical protein